MSHKAEFYLKDVKGFRLAKGNVPAGEVVRPNVLHFRFSSPSLVENSPPVEIDEPAAEEHKTRYASEYKAFLKSQEPEGVTASLVSEKKSLFSIKQKALE